MSFRSSFHYDVDEEGKMIIIQGHCLCGVCMFPHVCLGFLRGPWFPPTSQSRAQEVNRGVYTVPSE